MSELYAVFGSPAKDNVESHRAASQRDSTSITRDELEQHGLSTSFESHPGRKSPSDRDGNDHCAWKDPAGYREVLLKQLHEQKSRSGPEVSAQLTTPGRQSTPELRASPRSSFISAKSFLVASQNLNVCKDGKAQYVFSDRIDLDTVTELGYKYAIDPTFFVQHAVRDELQDSTGMHANVWMLPKHSNHWAHKAVISICILRPGIYFMLLSRTNDTASDSTNNFVGVYLSPISETTLTYGTRWYAHSDSDEGIRSIWTLTYLLQGAFKDAVECGSASLFAANIKSLLADRIETDILLPWLLTLTLWESEFSTMLSRIRHFITVLDSADAAALRNLIDLHQEFEFKKARCADFRSKLKATSLREIDVALEKPRSGPGAAIEERCLRLEERIANVRSNLVEANQLLVSWISIQDSEFMKTQAERTTTLTILAAVFLPLTLVTGMFGMNVAEINGASPAWWAAMIALAAVIVVAAVILAAIKWRKDIWRAAKRIWYWAMRNIRYKVLRRPYPNISGLAGVAVSRDLEGMSTSSRQS